MTGVQTCALPILPLCVLRWKNFDNIRMYTNDTKCKKQFQKVNRMIFFPFLQWCSIHKTPLSCTPFPIKTRLPCTYKQIIFLFSLSAIIFPFFLIADFITSCYTISVKVSKSYDNALLESSERKSGQKDSS